MREIVTIQVGQCGNQIGRSFWSRALHEHAANSHYADFGGGEGGEGRTGAVFSESMSTFFRNVDMTTKGEMAPGSEIRDLKARACLIDMEDGVLSETMRGPLKDLFTSAQVMSDVSGAGNNWAHGFYEYGNQYGDQFLELVRSQAEPCDSLQSFFLMHSLGGGTGSGLGTKLLELLKDNYDGIYRFATSVLPSSSGEGDDVITSPYNSVLALNQLTEHADAVLPIDNARLSQLSSRISGSGSGGGGGGGVGDHAAGNATSAVKGKKKNAAGKKNPTTGGFDEMNNVVARLLTDLTASMRFAGDLNTDLNEITTNLVPFPRMHYLCPSLAPMGPTTHHAHRSNGMNSSVLVKSLFRDCFSPESSLVSLGEGCNIRNSSVLACGVFVRGKGIPISDVNSNVARLQSELRMPRWNREGFKIGLCEVPGLDHQSSIMSLCNSEIINSVFVPLSERFYKLYRRKANVHHYTQFCDGGIFDEAIGNLENLIEEYKAVGGRGGGGGEGGGRLPPRGDELIWDVNESSSKRKELAF
ncbi:hypothetical protein TrLO_g3844 [Triparma laevis f. longispina]|uniref:Tubulin/FtsZ GTPase domain-containing protein n=1 Tax=Triparma laevis f. longispina TaxID=1714387 RepID=A0A9W7C7L8_9STRA|nr:hypothetical protein TrLO_g3844 [Triparma laevis f. longispina]